MHLSTRGRYAVMAMLDLAKLETETDRPIPLSDIAERQHLSLSYLEQLFARLRRAELVQSIRGPGGGYRLAKAEKTTFLGEIIRAVDEPTDMTGCGKPAEGVCRPDGKFCNAHKLWVAFGAHIDAFLDSISLAQVLDDTLTSLPITKQTGKVSVDVRAGA